MEDILTRGRGISCLFSLVLKEHPVGSKYRQDMPRHLQSSLILTRNLPSSLVCFLSKTTRNSPRRPPGAPLPAESSPFLFSLSLKKCSLLSFSGLQETRALRPPPQWSVVAGEPQGPAPAAGMGPAPPALKARFRGSRGAGQWGR